VRAARAAALVCLLALGRAWPASAQALLTQPQRYVLTTEAGDGRALWVQPAGLARRREASIAWSITGSRQAGVTTLEQYGATLASGGVGLGFQHAELVDGTDINQYAIGYAVGSAKASFGLARRWIQGGRAKDVALDIGMRAVPTSLFEASLVLRDFGNPVVRAADPQDTAQRDTTYRATLTPGVALRLFGARLRMGADWELVTKGWGTSAVRLGTAIALPLRLELAARAEFSGDFVRRDLAVAVTWNGSVARATGFASIPQGTGADAYGLWGSALRDLDARRRWGGR
jgi:hypothetical protein